MARSLFVIFLAAILLLFVLLFITMVENNNLIKKSQSQQVLIDSLQSECFIMDITIGRYEFIIEQFKEQHPQVVKKIYDEIE